MKGCEEMTEEVVEQLVEDYGDSILRMCYLYVKDYQIAEDITQETFIQVYKKYHTFEHKASVKTWIMRIAINKCKNYMRLHWFKMRVNSELQDMEQQSQEDNILTKEMIVGEISRLKPKYKEVILLYYYQELSISEISSVLEEKESAVKVRLKRAREQLKPGLQEALGYE